MANNKVLPTTSNKHFKEAQIQSHRVLDLFYFVVINYRHIQAFYVTKENIMTTGASFLI